MEVARRPKAFERHSELLLRSVSFCDRTAMIVYKEVKECWDGLHVLHGLPGLALLKDYDHECLRETLMEFVPLTTDPQSKHAMISVVQFLTVIASMTFKAQMDGEDEIKEAYVWIDFEQAKQSCQRDRFDPELELTFEEKIKRMCTNRDTHLHYKSIVALSQTYLGRLLDEVTSSAEFLRSDMPLCAFVLNDFEYAFNHVDFEGTTNMN